MHARGVLVVALGLALAPASASAAPKDQPLPGFSGLSYRDVEVRGGCTDSIRVIRRTKKVDDPELVTLLTWSRITGLDFSPDNAAKAKTSLKRFQEWFQRLSAQGTKVKDRQAAIARDTTRPAVVRVEAIARLVLAEQQIVDLLLGIEVPRHLRKDPEMVDTYCDVLSDHTEALEVQVDEARAFCQKLITDNGVGFGWWTGVCASTGPGAAAPPPAAAKP